MKLHMLIMEEQHKITILGFGTAHELHMKSIELSEADPKATFRVLKVKEYSRVKDGKSMSKYERTT